VPYIPGDIYFVREIDPKTKGFTDFVKIGLVRESEGRSSFDRLKQHQTGNPKTLKLLSKEIVHTEAVDRVEALLHKFYAEQRVSGEWFEFKSEQQVQDAIKRTKAFSKEVSKIVPIFEKAEGLAKVKDNGKTIPASDEHRKLLSTISLATLELSEIKSLENIITGKFVAAVKAGVSGIEKVVKAQIRTIQPKFDTKLFMDEEPEIYAKYVMLGKKLQASFLTNAKIKKAASLSHDFELFLEFIDAQISAVKSVEDSALLNEPLLAITKQKALSSWELEVAKAQLRVGCGRNLAIEGVCSWKRQFSETTIFNEGQFQEENPDLWSSYLTDEKTGTYLIPKKRKIS
jgi:hypothetical protein